MKTALTTLFFSFSSAYLIVYRGVRLFISGFISEEITFPRFQREFHLSIFQGVQLFPGWGIQMLFSIETHITCEVSGG